MAQTQWTRQILARAVLAAFFALPSLGLADSRTGADLQVLAQQAVESALNHGAEQDPGDTRPLVLFFVFGWTGKLNSFCDLPQILENLYNKNGQGRVLTKVLSYQTLDAKLSTKEFAKEIYPQILQFFSDHGLKSDNPYSLIMHSQGGVVGVKYVELCLREQRCAQATDALAGVPTNLRHFISLAAPFWGSAEAGNFDAINHLIHLPVPTQQTSDLGIASRSLGDDRSYLIYSLPPSVGHHFNPVTPFFMPQTQVYAIGGDISDIKGLGLVDPVEFDEVVELPDSRLDFNYYFERMPDDPAPLTGSEHLTREWKPLLVAHSPLNVAMFHRPGVACVHQAEILPDHPGGVHPVYPMLKKWLDRYFGIHEPLFAVASEQANLVRRSINFGVELQIHLPDGYEARELNFGDRNVDIQVDPAQITRTRHSNTFISKIHGIRRANDTYGKFLTYFHEGDMAPDYAYVLTLGDDPTVRNALVNYTIRVPGFEEKKITLTVNAGRTSFASIYLKPLLPIPALEISGGGSGYLIAIRRRLNGAIEKWMTKANDALGTLVEETTAANQMTTDDIGKVNRCLVGFVGNFGAGHTTSIYSEFAGMQMLMRTRVGEAYFILGRFREDRGTAPVGSAETSATDRYLVTSLQLMQMAGVNLDTFGPAGGVGWIDVNALDVSPDTKCPL